MLKRQAFLLAPTRPPLGVSHFRVRRLLLDEAISRDGIEAAAAAATVQVHHSRLARYLVGKESFARLRCVGRLVERIPLSIYLDNAQEVRRSPKHQVLAFGRPIFKTRHFGPLFRRRRRQLLKVGQNMVPKKPATAISRIDRETFCSTSCILHY